jgi:hypothetical protein
MNGQRTVGHVICWDRFAPNRSKGTDEVKDIAEIITSVFHLCQLAMKHGEPHAVPTTVRLYDLRRRLGDFGGFGAAGPRLVASLDLRRIEGEV